MKLKYILLPVLLVCFLFTSEVLAQGYESPSRERVESLLEQLEVCKESLANAEKGLGIMKKNPEDYSLETYLWVENLAKEAKECIVYTRKQLDQLRIDYPGWFNSPNATIAVQKPIRRRLTPREIQEAIDKVDKSIANALARFQAMNRPSH